MTQLSLAVCLMLNGTEFIVECQARRVKIFLQPFNRYLRYNLSFLSNISVIL